MNEIHKLSATQLSNMLKSKEISATEIAEGTIRRINSVESKIDSFLTITPEIALAAAKVTDGKIASGATLGAIEGIPFALKDNICTKDVKTTCASKMLGDFIPPYSATVADHLTSAGGVLCGKLNMDEFAMGSSCETSYFKTTKNPWDLSCVPGGSSGGSAAAVAACEVPFSLGSDTGGSVRCPAGFCGVVGLKPTYGTVSRYGVVAFASSLDQIGPMARTVDDVELLFSVISGKDIKDATSKNYKYKSENTTLKGLKIGIPAEYFGEGISPEVKTAVLAGVKTLEDMGAVAIPLSLPSTDFALSAYYIISSAEASSNLARYDGVKYGYSGTRDEGLEKLYLTSRSEGFGEEVKRRIMLGTYVLSSGYFDAYYKKAKLFKNIIAKEFNDAFTKCDVIISPVTPTTAFKFGERTTDPLQMYASDICTVPVNIAELPALSVPCGFDKNNLPIGMQIIGAKFSENKLLSVAKSYETAVGGFAVKEM